MAAAGKTTGVRSIPLARTTTTVSAMSTRRPVRLRATFSAAVGAAGAGMSVAQCRVEVANQLAVAGGLGRSRCRSGRLAAMHLRAHAHLLLVARLRTVLPRLREREEDIAGSDEPVVAVVVRNCSERHLAPIGRAHV